MTDSRVVGVLADDASTPTFVKDTVLVVTDVSDVHADAVIAHLNERKIATFRLHPADIPARVSFSLHIEDGRYNGMIETQTRRLPLDRIAAAWIRRPGRPQVSLEMDPEAREYVVAQVDSALHSLYQVLDARWVCNPELVRTAEAKALQLRRAHSVGLTTPRTLISNDERAILQYCQSVDGE